MFMSSLEHDIPVSANNMPGRDEWTLRPSQQPYCTIQVQVRGDNGKDFTLSLLLDTACSGILLRPEVVTKHNLRVVTSPVTMTSGGGTASSNSQVTNLASFSLKGGDDDGTSKRQFGPLPAVVQDIGALPKALDGIIGLSFLSQFEAVEFDFVNSQVSFYESEPPPASDTNAAWELVGQGDMYMLGSLGIYAVDTWWANQRGPVRMLVDTGAASTYWSWAAVTQDLKIPRDSSMISKLPGYMGIMGSDNMANPLTHRIYVSSRIGLPQGPGLSLADCRLAVDIGDIPILQSLRTQGVGGILGLDVLRRCSVVRMRCRGTKPYISLYKLKSEQ